MVSFYINRICLVKNSNAKAYFFIYLVNHYCKKFLWKVSKFYVVSKKSGQFMTKESGSPFFLTLNCASDTVANATGSSVTKRTLSRETVANRRRSLKRRAQYGLTALPSTLDSSPPKIHCRPAVLRTKGCKKKIE